MAITITAQKSMLCRTYSSRKQSTISNKLKTPHNIQLVKQVYGPIYTVYVIICHGKFKLQYAKCHNNIFICNKVLRENRKNKTMIYNINK